jgi:hypothetical protein
MTRAGAKLRSDGNKLRDSVLVREGRPAVAAHRKLGLLNGATWRGQDADISRLVAGAVDSNVDCCVQEDCVGQGSSCGPHGTRRRLVRAGLPLVARLTETY